MIPILEKYDDFKRKEVVIETPPDNETKGRIGMPGPDKSPWLLYQTFTERKRKRQFPHFFLGHK